MPDYDRMVKRLAFLASAGEILASTLDVDQTMQGLAQLALPILGDLCIVDVMDDGVLRGVATAHVDPAKALLMQRLRREYPLTPHSPQPAARALRSGQVELLDRVTSEVVDAHVLEGAHARLIHAIGIRSHLAVPLVARNVTVGVISLGISESDRRYGEHDVALARDLARRAAVAIDNARLYKVAQDELARRGQVEEALRLSERRFRAIVDQSPLSTQILEPSGRTLRVNRAWQTLWGLTPEQIVDYNVLSDPQLEAQGITVLLRRAFAGESVRLPTIRYDPNEVVPPGDGEPYPVRWVRAFAYPVTTAGGGVREVVLVHEDVTQARHAEQQLQASVNDLKVAEENTRLLADAGGALGTSLDYHVTLQTLSRLLVPRLADWCAVDLLSDDGTLERVAVHHQEPALLALAHELFTRYPPSQSAPHGVWHVIRTGEPEWASHIDDDLLEDSAQDDTHLSLLRQLHLRSFISVPLVARNATVGVLTLAHAESGRRYKASDVTLAVDVARRVAAAVENAQLYQRLRAEDRRKDEFLATLAHELRNPLAPIRSGLALLRLTSDATTLENTRLVMERQLGHMVRLIDDLLDLSRISTGRVQLAKEHVDVATIVSTAVETSRPLLDHAGVALGVHLPSTAIMLDADRTRLAQILANLLNNAAKFTAAGGRVDLEVVEDGPDVLIRITDSGIGIPRHMLAHVFEMFAQVGDRRTRQHGGLGIGLTLVRRLVQLHEGQVWAESDGDGSGSTFVVRLPRADSLTIRDQRLASVATAAPAPARRRVLVVDDNIDAATMLATLIELSGHDVQTAFSGATALEKLRHFHADVAFLDIGMPGMNGYELARRIRAEPHLVGMTLVAVTGWGQDEDRRQSREAGLDHHLTKPVDATQVLALVSPADVGSL